MKKLASFILAALLILSATAAASAEIDLSTLSWDELAALQQQITMEQLGRDEWQEVEVPQGVYKVGEDIPAGKWTITCNTGSRAYIKWGDILDESGADIAYSNRVFEYENVYNPKDKYFKTGSRTELTIDMKEGWYIIVEYSSVTFTPYTGKTSLGFK